MKLNNRILYFLIVLCFAGQLCLGQKGPAQPFLPIEIKQEKTSISLIGYFPNIAFTGFSLGHEPRGTEVRVIDNFNIELQGKLKQGVDYIGIIIDGNERAIPLINRKLPPDFFVSPLYVTSYLYEPKNNNLILKADKKGAKIVAFLNNYAVDLSQMQQMYDDKNTLITFPLPDFAKNVNQMDLVIYSYRGKQTGNQLWVPIGFGKPINRPQSVNINPASLPQHLKPVHNTRCPVREVFNQYVRLNSGLIQKWKTSYDALSDLTNERMEMQFGDALILHKSDQQLVVMLNYMNQQSIIAVNTAQKDVSIDFLLPDNTPYHNIYDGDFLQEKNFISLEIPADGYSVLLTGRAKATK